MKRETKALAAALGTNVGGYVVSLAVINLGRADTPSLLWPLGVMLWLAAMILGGWVASFVVGSKQYLLGYVSALVGLLCVALVFRLGLGLPVPLFSTAIGALIVSALGVLGAATYSLKSK